MSQSAQFLGSVVPLAMFNVLLIERLKRHVINQKNFNSSFELARQMTSVATVQFCQNKHWVKTNRSPLDQLNTLKELSLVFYSLLDQFNFLEFI